MHPFTYKTSSNICFISPADKAYCIGPHSGETYLDSTHVYESFHIITNYWLFPFLIKFAASDEQPRQFLSMPEEALQMVLSQVTDQNLRHTLQFGIGLHHAGLNDKDRSLVEELFSNNRIQAFFYDLISLSVLICYAICDKTVF